VSGETAPDVKLELAEGVKGDIAELTADSSAPGSAQQDEIDMLKRRIAGLFIECETNPHAGELMGPGRHPELADCRRIRFDVETHKGKPRFRLIYRNEPSDGPWQVPLARNRPARRSTSPPQGTTTLFVIPASRSEH
jgi:hypothetical protein